MATVTAEGIPGGDITSLTAAARLLAEGLISVSRAAALFGEYRGGKRTHNSTVTRWCLTGVRLRDGRVVRLEYIRLGSRLATTAQAVVRFVEAQQSDDAASDGPVAVTLTQASRQRAAASKTLDTILG